MIAHQNVILDSIIGEDVWFGGYSGTVNVTDDRKNVRYQIGERLMDTGTDHFGAGWNCYRQERNCLIYIEGEII
jgi:hypothetical protein